MRAGCAPVRGPLPPRASSRGRATGRQHPDPHAGRGRQGDRVAPLQLALSDRAAGAHGRSAHLLAARTRARRLLVDQRAHPRARPPLRLRPMARGRLSRVGVVRRAALLPPDGDEHAWRVASAWRRRPAAGLGARIRQPDLFSLHRGGARGGLSADRRLQRRERRGLRLIRPQHQGRRALERGARLPRPRALPPQS